MSFDREMPGVRHGEACECVRCRGFAPNNQVAVKHGCNSALLVDRHAVAIAADIRRLAPHLRPEDSIAVELLSVQLAKLRLAEVWFAEHGVLGRDGRPAPVMRVYSTWAAEARRLLERLGMTPSARAGVGVAVVAGDGEIRVLVSLALGAVLGVETADDDPSPGAPAIDVGEHIAAR